MNWEDIRDAFGETANRKYKRCNEYLVELELCPETKTNEFRSGVVDARFAKFRASQLKTTRILNTQTKKWVDEINHVWNDNMFKFEFPIVYKVGMIAYPSGFDTRLNDICAEGIHYFNTLLAAFAYTRFV